MPDDNVYDTKPQGNINRARPPLGTSYVCIIQV
jgi:hypothetical protein